ncbi:hypothetical protein FHR81_000474 [Actinoalloteichus hoggarensis]|uniref:FHA domain protein n=1 Tax=Actinoalloteichus hoggarensis TaxID=1470176 RepID=A0A221W241_9PSEU|nr:FHA domain-containing protein [Actinoalloteichus hoggarensis]ASO19846.1 FHA domain protein [Actinoalloteichus hoggarensis]MBB5919445.1 hypothetical protein [Actinoalloteichus hoggarensis]
MRTCPAGHTTPAVDYCEVCGRELTAARPVSPVPWWRGGDVVPAAPVLPWSQPGSPDPIVPVVEPGRCPECGTPRGGRFCEECGRDSFARAADDVDSRAEPRWHALITVDPDWFEAVTAREGLDVRSLVPPLDRPPRRVALTSSEVLLGRGGGTAMIPPDVDLGDDPGVSQRHARLTRTAADRWELVDLGSTNGTVLGDGEPVRAHTPRTLADGARLFLGAWTAVELRTERTR